MFVNLTEEYEDHADLLTYSTYVKNNDRKRRKKNCAAVMHILMPSWTSRDNCWVHSRVIFIARALKA